MNAAGSFERIFAADYGAADGHFPGNPIIPGAMLLSEILTMVAAEAGMGRVPERIRSAKFLAPVRPGARVLVRFTATAKGSVDIACSVDGAAVLELTAHCDQPG